MILFDTDTCIELLCGNGKVINKRLGYDGDIGISFMTVAELYFGVENSTRIQENLELIEKFFLTVQLIQSDIPILKKFGELKVSLKKVKTILPDADIFIASTSLVKAEKLITGNVKHFSRIEELKVENWIK